LYRQNRHTCAGTKGVSFPHRSSGEFKQMILRENIISLAESKDGLEGCETRLLF
jgi:hypothetical protein